jgi:hypothetical protein
MNRKLLSESQEEIIHIDTTSKVFVEGPAGSGKTTIAVLRLEKLIESGIRGENFLVLVPQRTLAAPYYNLQQNPAFVRNGLLTITTMYGLARNLIQLFWPAISEEAGFTHPDRLPIFLNLETAQYFMAHLVRPLLDEGFFETINIERSRLYSQILDNLNKSALVGFPYQEIGSRLKSAWTGEYSQLRVYDDVQTCANLFREYCYQNNLLDLSLQIELMRNSLWKNAFVKAYLQSRYRHLIYDNSEEDTPIAHDIVSEWLTSFNSAFIIYDWNAGYRTFLGADPNSAYQMKYLCDYARILSEVYTSSKELLFLESRLVDKIDLPEGDIDQELQMPLYGNSFQLFPKETLQVAEIKPVERLPIIFEVQRYFPEMLEWVAKQVSVLVNDEAISPENIVILSPYLPDALRFTILHHLESMGIPARSHRPSRSLSEEPATRCLFTLAKIAYQDWGFRPARSDVANALFQAIEDLDLVRAQLLTEIVYRIQGGKPTLTSFELIQSEVQERITYRIGEKFEVLRNWLLDRSLVTEPGSDLDEELEYFFGRLFGEVLSQPGYGFRNNLDAGVVTANLIQSIRNFRHNIGNMPDQNDIPIGKEYLLTVEDGLIAGQYIPGWQARHEKGVLVSPALSFCLANTPVDYQIWIDIGSRGWYERLDQPLTHPFVLNRNWQTGRPWTDMDEVKAGEIQLLRLIKGLIRRCRKGIILGLSELDDQGYEERGRLIQMFQEILVDSIG